MKNKTKDKPVNSLPWDAQPLQSKYSIDRRKKEVKLTFTRGGETVHETTFPHNPDAPSVQIKYFTDRKKEKIKLTYIFGGGIKMEVCIKTADVHNLWTYLQFLDKHEVEASELRKTYWGILNDLWNALWVKYPADYFQAMHCSPSSRERQRYDAHFRYTRIYCCAPRLYAFIKEELKKPSAERDPLIKKTLSLPEEETNWLRPTLPAVTAYLLRKLFPELLGNKEDDNYIIDQYVYRSPFSPAKKIRNQVFSCPDTFRNSHDYSLLSEAINNLSK